MVERKIERSRGCFSLELCIGTRGWRDGIMQSIVPVWSAQWGRIDSHRRWHYYNIVPRCSGSGEFYQLFYAINRPKKKKRFLFLILRIFLQGWWKGELRGQVGMFPDNFVEVLGSKNEHRRSDPDQWHETSQGTSKSSSKHSSYTRQRGEKAHARKSLDSRLVHTGKFVYELQLEMCTEFFTGHFWSHDRHSTTQKLNFCYQAHF